MTSVDGLLSPESTVTSLLASSGRLRSSLHPEPVPTIRYKDREYGSASDALDAYITDFQKSLRTTGTSAGQLELPNLPATPHVFRSRFRNRDVLKESLTERELDFLSLPIGSQRRSTDRLSMTTDDLLVLPADGSLPVTRTSAFLSQSNNPWLGYSAHSSSWSASRHYGGASVPPRTTHRHFVSATGKSLRLNDLRLKRSAISQDLRLSSNESPLDTLAAHHLPRWMTSQKSEMDFSGVTSVPDLTYPAWLGECDVPTDGTVGQPPQSTNLPSWLEELDLSPEDSPQDHEVCPVDVVDDPEGLHRGHPRQCKTPGRGSLRELRLKFANQLAAAENGKSAREDGPFRDDKIESLILKAEQALCSPSLGLTGPGRDSDGHGSPAHSEELLEAERSWDNPPVMFKSPVPVGGDDDLPNTKEAQSHKKEKSLGSCSSGYSSRKHPGPVEALKQMLFSLQAVEQRVTQKEPGSLSMPNVIAPNPIEQEPESAKVAPLDIEDYDTAPGGQSLQRALLHLGRLKSLVDDMNERKEKELKEEMNLQETI